MTSPADDLLRLSAYIETVRAKEVKLVAALRQIDEQPYYLNMSFNEIRERWGLVKQIAHDALKD